MSAATASIKDVSRTANTDDEPGRDKSGQSKAQCTPIPLPALGTQKIIQGNGTNVGTVISLQCPAKHKLIGSELTCVMDTNSTHWVGETYCKPLSPYEDYGFHVAVLASIVSSAIILFMSVVFITSCLLNCVKEDKKKKERESDVWQWQEQAQHQDNRSHYSHKGRNNNNNKAQQKVLSLWDPCSPAIRDSVQTCRCHPQHIYGPTPPLSALPGHQYAQPVSPRNPESVPITTLPSQYIGPPQSSCQSLNPGLDHISAARPTSVWQHGGQQSSLYALNPSSTDEPDTGNVNRAKDLSIRIVSV